VTARTAGPGFPGRAIALAALTAALGAVVAFGLLSIASAQASPVKALVMIAAPAFLILAVLWPDRAALVVPALVFSNAGLVLNQDYGVPNVLRGSLLLLFALLLTRATWRSALWQSTPILWASVIFVAVRVLSAIQAPGVDSSQVAFGYMYGLMVLLLVTALAARPRYMRAMAFVVVLTAGGIAAATILRRAGIGGTWMGFAGDTPITAELQAIMNRSGIPIDLAARVAGPVADPNFWAQCLVLAIPLGFWAFKTRTGHASRVLSASVIVVMFAGIMYTQSRGGMIALVIALSVWMWWQGGNYRKSLVLVPIAIIVALATTNAATRFSELQGLTNASQAEDGAIRGRLSENIAALHMWQDHPVLGVGADQYSSNYREYAKAIGLDSRAERFAHNSYLQMAAESGTLGAAAFIGMLVTAFVAGLRARRRLLEAEYFREASLLEAVLAGTLGFCIAAIFLHQAWPDYLWMSLGFIAGSWLLAERVRIDRQEATS